MHYDSNWAMLSPRSSRIRVPNSVFDMVHSTSDTPFVRDPHPHFDLTSPRKSREWIEHNMPRYLEDAAEQKPGMNFCHRYKAIENLVYGTFESEWKELLLEKKREVALEGLYRGACKAPRDNSRVISPELTIDSLVGDGEYNLIHLLNRIIAHDPTGNRRVKGLFLFVHPYVEHEYRRSDEAWDNLKAFIYYCLLLRNHCIVETLIGMLGAYHNHPPEPKIPTKFFNRLHNEERKEVERESRVERKKVLVDQSQCKEEAAIGGHGCYSCHTRAERNDLKRCGVASGQCQKKDWRTHKRYCGKRVFDPKFVTPESEDPEEFIGCPATVPGFTRTPALWRQIWYLSKADSQHTDYHFDTTYGHTRSVVIVRPEGARMVSLVARRRAMASGSIPAIHMMLKIIKYGSDDGVTFRGLEIKNIQRQFEKEYQITITPSSIRSAETEFAPPTREELDKERMYLAQRLARVPSDG
ncbi:hypothetical protein B0H19DRAFT_1275623 [Mycena capillaripes]|nr:hypothetical protein B0H19DRAFT_1275623 [Mycena capillaripes]